MDEEIIRVPRHEPEVIEAMARLAHGGDRSAVPTTSLREIDVDGIRLRSRQRRAEELRTLADMADLIPGIFGSDIEEIVCDGKGSWTLRVYLSDWSEDLAREVAEVIEAASITLKGGHGGISVFPAKSLNILDSFEIAPGWVDERS